MAVLETFEGVIGGWSVTLDTSGTGSTVTQSSDQAHAGTYSAKCFTTNSGAKAQVRDNSWASTWAGVPGANPGEHYWQRAFVYVPSATASALTGAEYLDLAGYYVSGTGAGFYLRLRADAALYIEGPGSGGQVTCNLWGTFPTDQWVEVEIGLWSQDTGDLDRAFAVVINGAFYGWFTNGASGTNYDRLAFGILDTNSTDDLTVYVDDYDVTTEGVSPAGSDNRPTGDYAEKDYRTQSGENVGYHYTTWENGPDLDATYGLSCSTRIQSGINHELMDSMEDGWSLIEINWTDGSTPSWPPSGVGNFFAPMIGFHKSIELEENLEVVFLYRPGSGTVDLVYESWTLGANEYADWEIPEDAGSHTIPGQGDLLFVRWEEVSATEMRVIVDYYDASTTTWHNRVIDDTRNLSNVDGVDFLDGDHLAVTNTIDSSEYTIVRQELGDLTHMPRKRLTGDSGSGSSSAIASGVTTTTTTTTTVEVDTDVVQP